jgi:DNA-directed RNA polymerase specialized sigma24 family protein
LTKEELEQLKSLKQEVKQLQDEIRNMPLTTDSVKGSMAEFPYTYHSIKIEGIDQSTAKRLRNKLERKLKELQESILEMEIWLDTVNDSETRTILRLTYRNGLTQEEIGAEMGYSRSAVEMKIKRFFEKNKSVSDLSL